jgi:acyl carrier protein
MSIAPALIRVEARAPLGSEAWLRALVADRLGVAEVELAPHVSLQDDLAADSLDFADVAAAMEAELGIAVPPALLRQVRTFGDLSELTEAIARERRRRAREGAALLRARQWSPGGEPTVIERVFWLDPHAIEILLDDASRARRGTRLEVVVDAATPSTVVARVRSRLARLQCRGVAVDVRRARRVA